MTSDPMTPLAVAPAPVLQYAQPILREACLLNIYVPPRPLARQMIWPVLGIVLFGIPACIFMLVMLMGPFDSSFFCSLAPTAFLTAGGVHSLRRLIYIAREGHTPVELHVSPGGIRFRAMGKYKTIDADLPRERVRDVRIYPSADGFGSWAMIVVISSDGERYQAAFPWKMEESMDKVENTARKLLGLTPVVDEITAASYPPQSPDSAPPTG